MKEKGHQDLSHVEKMMQVSFHEFNSSIHKFGIDAISALVSPAKQSDFVYALRKYTTYPDARPDYLCASVGKKAV